MRYVAHGYFAYVNEISFAYPEHLVHGGVAAPEESGGEETELETHYNPAVVLWPTWLKTGSHE